MAKNPKEIEEAIEFVNSKRGQFIISQALVKAIDAMEKEKYPEESNIADMKFILDKLYPIFKEVHRISKEWVKQ